MASMNLTEFNKFLKNNEQFLAEKYRQHFVHDTVKRDGLKSQILVKYIYDVFLFSKYEEEPQTNSKIQQSLGLNIDQFFNANPGDNFSNETAIQLLEFCIQNNDMFAVHYDLNDRPSPTENGNQKQRQEMGQGNPEYPNKNYENNQKDQTQKNDLDGIRRQQRGFEGQLFDQKQDQSESPSRDLSKNQSFMKNSFLPIGSGMLGTDNQFVSQESGGTNKINEKLVKKNAKLLFDFYCKEQMSLGVNNTFDRLQYENSRLTLGAFITFAKEVGLVSKQITRELLAKKFKKIAQGSPGIDFDTFYLLLSQIRILDESLYYRIKFDEPISKGCMKAMRLAFNTKDQSSRQLVPVRVYQSKLSMRSDRSQKSGRGASLDQINIRKVSERYVEESSMIKLNDLAGIGKERFSQDLGFLAKVLKNAGGPRKVNHGYEIQIPKKEKRATKIDSNNPNSHHSSRQERLLGDLQKRIGEMEARDKVYSRKRKNRLEKNMSFQQNVNKFLKNHF